MKLMQAVLVLLVAAGPAAALEYTCPSDPGFCYLDVGNDGCFDVGTDTGPIDEDLEAGSFPAAGVPGPGSIVCPPDSGNLKVAVVTTWESAPGGAILLYGTRVIGGGGPISITSGARLFLGGRVSNTNAMSIQAEDDVEIGGSLLLNLSNSGVDVTSVLGGIVIGPRVKIKAGGSTFTAAGDIELRDRVTLQFKALNDLETDFVTPGNLTAQNLVSTGGSALAFDVGNLELTEKVKVNPSWFTVLATGTVRIDRIIQKTGEVDITAASIEIGLPGSNGKVRPSKLNTSQDIRMAATGDIQLDRVKMLAGSSFSGPDPIDLNAGGDVSVTDGVIRSTPSKPRDVTLTAGTGFICDLTDTKFLSTNLTLNCDTVVGP